jgi:hypothetical protein
LKEPRIHFALVCAAVSCPPLRGEAYRPEEVLQQLTDQAFVFLNDASRNYYSVQDKSLHLSKIFQWFKEDFDPPGIQVFVKAFLPESLQNNISADTEIKWLSYDWTLNSQE